MKALKLMHSVMAELDIALLERIAPREYAIVGKPPAFYTSLYSDLNAPWNISNFLEFFLDTAELFFKNQKEGEDDIISSGFWQEEGVNSQYALVAYAMAKDGAQAIIVRLIKEEFIERQTILQKARENLLEQRRLRMDASYDSLTGLFNKKTFMLAFRESIKKAKMFMTPLSVLMLDIDDFKMVNDTYGHLAGDAILSEFGALLSSAVRTSDILARYGGEEFIISVPNNIEQAVGIAEKICAKTNGYVFPEPGHITVSVGCTEYKKGDNEEALISRADQALYDAKRNGKNTWSVR